MGSTGMRQSVAMALRSSADPPNVTGAVRALIAAGLIAVTGALLGDLQSIGIAYFGAACTISFAGRGLYRSRLLALSAQACGAVVGLSLGLLLPTSAVILVLTAMVAGGVSGLLGGIGPNAPAFGIMLTIGVAFGQFGGSTMAWWQQCVWYLVGTALVGAAIFAPLLIRRRSLERQAVADVFFAAADVCTEAGTTSARTARSRLATASAAARAAGHFPAAELTAFAAATCYADGRPVPVDVVEAIRTAGRQVLEDMPITVTFDPREDPRLRALADALGPAPQRPPAPAGRKLFAVLRSLGTTSSVANAARIGLCMGVATVLTIALHRPADGFWLPLTVAVIVRPEFASVFVRTVNRVTGTLLGAVIAAVVLELRPSSVIVAVAAAAALSVAVLLAPKRYALYVIGITVSTLLSASLGHVDAALAGVRLVDTVIAAAVAIVFGYLLWPESRRLPGTARIDLALPAVEAYLTEAIKPGDRRDRWQSRRDDAYRCAHQVRAASEAAAAEPPPVNHLALQMIPVAVRLEDIVDAVTAVASAVDSHHDVTTQVGEVRQRIVAVRAAADAAG